MTAMASAASGDASPRDFISFLLSRNSVPLLSGLVRGLMRSVFRNRSLNAKRYDLAKVGRFKVNKKLGLNLELSSSILTISDIVATLRYLVALHRGDLLMEYGREVRVEKDDIDHFGNRRLRTVGELIQNQVRIGLSRMERVVRERMTTQDVEAITPQTLINIRPVVASI